MPVREKLSEGITLLTLQTQADADSIEHQLAHRGKPLIKLRHVVPKVRENIGRKPNIRLYWIEFATNLVALLSPVSVRNE